MIDRCAYSSRRFVTLSVFVMVGCVIGHYLMSSLFRACPNSMKRAQVLIDSINSPGEKQPEICIFGNSVVMSGVDAKLVSKGLRGEPETWNLSSSAQGPLEGFLYFQDEPESTKVIVQCVYIHALEKEPGIGANKYNSICMYGLRPNEATRDIV